MLANAMRRLALLLLLPLVAAACGGPGPMPTPGRPNEVLAAALLEGPYLYAVTATVDLDSTHVLGGTLPKRSISGHGIVASPSKQSFYLDNAGARQWSVYDGNAVYRSTDGVHFVVQAWNGAWPGGTPGDAAAVVGRQDRAKDAGRDTVAGTPVERWHAALGGGDAMAQLVEDYIAATLGGAVAAETGTAPPVGAMTHAVAFRDGTLDVMAETSDGHPVRYVDHVVATCDLGAIDDAVAAAKPGTKAPLPRATDVVVVDWTVDIFAFGSPVSVTAPPSPTPTATATQKATPSPSVKPTP